MATLTSAITATQRSFKVSGDLSNVTLHTRYRIGDELIELSGYDVYDIVNARRQPGTDPTKWRVNRGVGQSVAASHDAGAEITAAVSAAVSAETLAPPSPFASGVQTVRLLGPYHVDVTDVGIDQTGGSPTTLAAGGLLTVADLPDGCVVVATWAEATVSMDNANVKIAIDVQPTDDPNNSSDISTGWSSQVDDTALETFAVGSAGAGSRLYARVVTGAQLMVYLTGGTPVSGEFDVYALIAEPA